MFVKILLVVSGVLLVGCGGGSGASSSSAGSLTYNGKTTKATLDKKNSNHFLLLMQRNFTKNIEVPMGKKVLGSDSLVSIEQKFLKFLPKKNKVIDSDSRAGKISGTVSIVVEETGTTTGKITTKYKNFSDVKGLIFNGTVIYSLTVNANEVVTKNISDYQMFQIQIEKDDITIDGTVTALLVEKGKKSIENYIIKNNKTSEMLKFEKFTTLLNSQLQPLSYSGKIYDSNYGYIDVSTLTPLIYNEDGTRKPEGELKFEGEASNVTVRYAYDNRIRLEIDKNKDGTVDSVQVYREGNYEEEIPNAKPVIKISFPKSIYTDTDMSQVKVNVYDPDLDKFSTSYKWSINGKNMDTGLVLDNTLFKKHDILKLTVVATDDRVGGIKVGTQSNEQEVLNTVPVASIESNAAGTSMEALEKMQLNASSSTDKDNDILTYGWKVYKYIPETEVHGETVIETVWTDIAETIGDIDIPYVVIEVNASKYMKNLTSETPIFSAVASGKHIIKCTVLDDDMAESTTELNLTINPLGILQNTEAKVFFPNQDTLTEWTSGNSIYAFDLNNDGQKELLYFTKDPNDETKTLLHITYSPKSENSITKSYHINDSAIFNIKDFKDFNGDGKIDIILGGYKNSVMFQTTQDSFSNPNNIFIYENMTLIDDFNGDGKIDGIRLNRCNLEIYTNFDDFSQIETTYTVQGCKTEDSKNVLKISDFNNDGVDDFMIFSHSTYDEKGEFVIVYRNSQNLLTESNITVVNERVFSETLSVGDINGDGFNDVIVDFVLFENSKNFNFKKVQMLEAKNNGSTNDRISISDINNDKKEDILYHNGNILRVMIQGDNYQMNDFELKPVIDNMLIADINKDGKAEIIENYQNRIEISTLK